MRIYILLLIFTFTLHLGAQQSDFNEIDFTKAVHIASMLEGEDLKNLPILVHNLTAPLDTDVERFKAIYYWVTHNISGDYDMTLRNDRKRSELRKDPVALQTWNNEFKKEVFKRLLIDQETLCSGYSYLIQIFSIIAGLECEIINGYDPSKMSKFKDANHSWNAIKLDGKWYLCDATWSSGYTDMSSFLFEFDYDNSYFLMEPSEFIKTHQPLDPQWELLPAH